jgi:DNA repair exonuclease SbcCD ATPase subunit
MRLVRLDDVAPGGRQLDLHPRLTVLVGVPEGIRDLLCRAVRALVDGREPPVGGVLEAHGTLVELSGASIAALGLGPHLLLDPVLDLGAERLGSGQVPGPAAGPSPRVPRVEILPVVPDTSLRVPTSGIPPAGEPPGPSPVPPPAPPADPTRTARTAAEAELSQHRDQLRSLTGELVVLARQMEEARAGLDSFARADLAAARERVEVLAARVRQATEDRESRLREFSAQREALAERRAGLVAELERCSGVDPAEVRAAAGRLATLLETPAAPDPFAAELADRLDALRRADLARAERADAAARALETAEQQLAQARDELRELTGAHAPGGLDPALVARLEVLRDEIFDLEERGGRLGAGRNRRRVEELRAEEAEILDRLGFDTYSAFVMGVRSARSVTTRAIRVDEVRARVEALEHEVERLRADLPGGAEDQRGRSERTEITREAAALLGADPTALGRLTSAELAELLRSTTVTESPAHRAEIISAAAHLGSVLALAGEEPSPGEADPEARLAAARRWLAEVEAREARVADLSARIDEVDRELAQLDEVGVGDDGGRLADVRAELALAEERVAEAERRLDRHLASMAELADLRARELELRDRQRSVEAAIAEGERRLGVLNAATPPPFRGPVPTATGGPAQPVVTTPVAVPPVPGVPAVPAAVVGSAPTPSPPSTFGPVSREWRVLSRYADLRSVGTVGALPLLVLGLSAEPADTDAVLHRIESLSDLVQTLVVTDDERVAIWAGQLDLQVASVLRW